MAFCFGTVIEKLATFVAIAFYGFGGNMLNPCNLTIVS
jgi:hypothetical protein